MKLLCSDFIEFCTIYLFGNLVMKWIVIMADYLFNEMLCSSGEVVENSLTFVLI